MICKGLGHRTCEGGSLPLNPFGEALKKATYRWTAELCCDDSDGDGQTNGEELGDPACNLVGTWDGDSLLTDALRYYDVSHPGDATHTSKNVTAPTGTAACMALAKSTEGKGAASSAHWLPKGEFFLPNEPRHSRDYFIQGFTVPSTRTTYVDFGWEFNEPECQTSGGKCYLVGAEAIVNTKYLHHYILNGCSEIPANFAGDGQRARPQYGAKCENIWGWAPGKEFSSPRIASKEMGAYKYLTVQIHYDNPDLDVGQQDNSGFKLHFTTVKRQHVSASMAPLRLSLAPAGEVSISAHTERWFLTSSCIVQTKEPVTLIAASTHAHLLGVEMYLHQARPDEVGIYGFNRTILEERNWYFDDQYDKPLLSQDIVLRDGDRLQATCVMNSSSRDGPTIFGKETVDEMCWLTTEYYPARAAASCKGARWTGELGAKELVSDLPSFKLHPPTRSSVYSGRSDLDSGECDVGHTALLDPCVAYTRGSAEGAQSPLRTRCCSMLQILDDQDCFCSTGFMGRIQETSGASGLAAVASDVCGISPVCAAGNGGRSDDEEDDDEPPCTAANIGAMMDAGAEGRQSAFIALLADNRKCAMCLQKCAGAADVQGCMLGCSRDDEDQDEMAPNADLSGSRQDPTPDPTREPNGPAGTGVPTTMPLQRTSPPQGGNAVSSSHRAHSCTTALVSLGLAAVLYWSS